MFEHEEEQKMTRTIMMASIMSCMLNKKKIVWAKRTDNGSKLQIKHKIQATLCPI